MAGPITRAARACCRGAFQVQSGWLYTRMAEAETALTDLRLIVAEARRLLDPQYTAELANLRSRRRESSLEDVIGVVRSRGREALVASPGLVID